MRSTIYLAWVVRLSLALAILCPWSYSAAKDDAVVGLVVTALDNPYFVEMADGARKSANEKPEIDLLVQAPERGAVDPERQQQLIETLIARHVSALLVVPADSTQIISSIVRSNQQKVPVIILDSDINRKVAAARNAKIAAFIGSDNVAGGKLAGDFIRDHLPPAGGEVAVLEGVPGVQAAVERKSGFLQSISLSNTIKIVASQPADWDREKAYNATKAILAAHPNLKAIFGSNDEMALGAARALKDAGKSDILVVGFDATPDGREAVKSGILAATIAQQPAEVGRLGVEYARRIILHESVPEQTSVPLQVISAKAGP